ncbi:hypothetical protein [Streptomyces sp. NPDC046939]|uniref:hypothetical protein n=1 Tax=Streptomyces sp. NPDC046939 TaxID=3155376 RepID=UPI0033D8A5B6
MNPVNPLNPVTPDFVEVPPLCPSCGKPMEELMDERSFDPETGHVHQRWECPDSRLGGHVD